MPRQYIETLAVLTDQAPPRPLSEVEATLREEFGGRGAAELFGHLSPQPLAAASLAQVHRGWLKDGTPVAVKARHQLLLIGRMRQAVGRRTQRMRRSRC